MTNEVARDTAAPAIVRASAVNISLDHPRLFRTDPESIHEFLRKYDQYSTSVLARANQFSTDVLTTEAIQPVDIKFCVDAEYLKSRIAMKLISDATDFASLTNDQVRAFLYTRFKSSQTSVTLEEIDRIVKTHLRTDMRIRDAVSRIEDLFTTYHTILKLNGVEWLLTQNQKVAVQHVLAAIRPQSLFDCLTTDLSFHKYSLRKYFKGFFPHALDISDAVQKLDSVRPSKTGGGGGHNNGGGGGRGRPGGRGRGGRGGGRGVHGVHNVKDPDVKTDELLLCHWEPHAKKGLRHLLKDCRECPSAEKLKLYSKRADDLTRDGPSKSTRSQTGTTTTPGAATQTPTGTKYQTAGRLHQPINPFDSPSCHVEVFDGRVYHTGMARCHDGSDESIASPSLAQAAVVKGVVRMTAITPIRIQVALRDSSQPTTLTFFRRWHVLRLVLHLSAGKMALLNLTFLFADDDTACEDMLIGVPVLRHLGINSRTILEQQWSKLDGTDCSGVDSQTHVNSCGLFFLMISRLKGLATTSTPHTTADLLRPRSNYFDNKVDDDPFPDPFLLQPEDLVADAAATISAVDEMLNCAKQNVFPDELLEYFEALIRQHTSAFSSGFSSAAAKVEPLRITLNDDAKPVRVWLRNYSHSQREFMANLFSDLTRHGLVYPKPTSLWASAPFIVPKSVPAGWRLTFDLRPVNQYTECHQFPMSVLEQELTKTAKSKFYAEFDFTHSYWQLLLHPDSQESQLFITPDGVFSPTRVQHVLRPNLLLWLDEFLLQSPTIDKFLQCLRVFLDYCDSYNCKLHPQKCILFARSVRWCGQVISPDGIRHDRALLDTFLDMYRPTTGGLLQQFVCAMQCLRSFIPNFQSLVRELHEFLESVYAHIGKRTKRAVARVSVDDLGWSSSHTTAFEACKQAIADRVTLAHRDEGKLLCIYTHASDTHWSGKITQVPLSDLPLPHTDQLHEPLSFHSIRFNPTQLCWSTIEKEAYAVLASVERSHWLATFPAGFDLYTDHNNLIFIFDPKTLMPDIGQGALRKVLRWSVRISSYNYVCYHIRGVDNLWSDLISRWSIPLTIRRLVHIPPLPTTFTNFLMPSKTTIRVSQDSNSATRPSSASFHGDVWQTSTDGPVWIPDGDTDLQLCLAVIAHTGAAGHRGRRATDISLSEMFHWSTLSADVRLFVQSCIHCLSTMGEPRSRVPLDRPFMAPSQTPLFNLTT